MAGWAPLGAADSGAAARPDAEAKTFVMGEPRESRNDLNRRALSLDPAGSNPSRLSSPSRGVQEEKGPAPRAEPFDVTGRESARSCRRRLDEPVAPALDVGNAVEAAGAGRAKQHRAMTARVGDDLEPVKTSPIGKGERFVEDDHLPGARLRFGGPGATGGGGVEAASPPLLCVRAIRRRQQIEDRLGAIAFMRPHRTLP